MQILDLVTLNVEIYQYPTRTVIAAILYLLIGKYFREFSLQEILGEFAQQSTFLFRDVTGFNLIYSEFLRKSFRLEIEEILPAIQFVSSYFAVKICYELPYAARRNPDEVLTVRFRNFILIHA